jgi:hypothetical protein
MWKNSWACGEALPQTDARDWTALAWSWQRSGRTNYEQVEGAADVCGDALADDRGAAANPS